jgi:hypothetical protein
VRFSDLSGTVNRGAKAVALAITFALFLEAVLDGQARTCGGRQYFKHPSITRQKGIAHHFREFKVAIHVRVVMKSPLCMFQTSKGNVKTPTHSDVAYHKISLKIQYLKGLDHWISRSPGAERGLHCLSHLARPELPAGMRQLEQSLLLTTED